VAQLVVAASFLGDGMQRVRGSSPLSSTDQEPDREVWLLLCVVAQLVVAASFLGDGMQRVRGLSPLSATKGARRRLSFRRGSRL